MLKEMKNNDLQMVENKTKKIKHIVKKYSQVSSKINK